MTISFLPAQDSVAVKNLGRTPCGAPGIFCVVLIGPRLKCSERNRRFLLLYFGRTERIERLLCRIKPFYNLKGSAKALNAALLGRRLQELNQSFWKCLCLVRSETILLGSGFTFRLCHLINCFLLSSLSTNKQTSCRSATSCATPSAEPPTRSPEPPWVFFCRSICST